jgi:hypothetical protein
MKRFMTVLVSLSFLAFSAAALTGCCCGDSDVNLDDLQKELEKAEKESKKGDDKADEKADDEGDDKADDEKADDKADEKADDKGGDSAGGGIEAATKIMLDDGWKSQSKSEAGDIKTATFSKKFAFVTLIMGTYPNQLSADASVKAYEKNANAVAKQDGKHVTVVLASGKADKKQAQAILDKITK